MDENTNTTVPYHVVVNNEEQYSIWAVGKEIPAGWRSVGEVAPKADCLAYIAEAWTDMRPSSLRGSAALPDPDGGGS